MRYKENSTSINIHTARKVSRENKDNALFETGRGVGRQ